MRESHDPVSTRPFKKCDWRESQMCSRMASWIILTVNAHQQFQDMSTTDKSDLLSFPEINSVLLKLLAQSPFSCSCGVKRLAMNPSRQESQDSWVISVVFSSPLDFYKMIIRNWISNWKGWRSRLMELLPTCSDDSHPSVQRPRSSLTRISCREGRPRAGLFMARKWSNCFWNFQYSMSLTWMWPRDWSFRFRRINLDWNPPSTA